MLKRILALPAMTLLLAACVTINIYFPAAAAEEAARTIVRDVLGKEEAPAKPESKPQGDKGAARSELQQATIAGIGWLLEHMVPAAHAAQANIDINTPVVRRIRASMAQRQGEMRGYYPSGAIGFDANGLVAVRDLTAAPIPERGKLRRLVADENRDRRDLYREIARANGHPEWESDIRQTFARVWVEEAPRGTWYQDARGGWRQK